MTSEAATLVLYIIVAAAAVVLCCEKTDTGVNKFGSPLLAYGVETGATPLKVTVAGTATGGRICTVALLRVSGVYL